MRSEQEMFDLILAVARGDARVRAVLMNGSRANPNAPRDFFQDFDIVYIVTDVDSYKRTPDWIRCFGELMILQLPDDMGDPQPNDWGGYGYLMQFMDGNRIDLGLFPLANVSKMEEDSQSILLLDKDRLFPHVPPTSDKDYLPKPPTAKQYFDCCNEFWWVSPYVAKGLWRRELPYAKQFGEIYVREQLIKMLEWAVGVQTGFVISPGKLGKYFEKQLPESWWMLLLATYSDGSYEHTWDALFKMTELFRLAAREVAQHFGYDYLQGEDERVSAHMRYVRNLPGDAKKMY